MGLLRGAAAVLLLLAARAAAFDVDLPVEHSIGSSFTAAGRLEGSLFDTLGGGGGSLTLRRKDLSAQDREALAQLVRAGGTYRLRIPADPSDAAGSPKVQAAIPARCLAAAGLKDALQVHASPQGHILGLTYDFSRLPCAGEGAAALPPGLRFPEASRVRVAPAAATPVLQRRKEPLLGAGGGQPAGAAGGQPAGRQGSRAPGEKAAPEEDTRPWIVKNWMITVPAGFVLLQLVGQLMAPEAAEGGGQAAPAPAGQRRRG